MVEVMAGIRAGAARGESLSLATVVAVEGSAYRHPGARLLLGPEGPRCGSVSGGCLEAELQARAAELSPGGRILLRFDLRGDLDLIWGSGSGCEGVAEILLERLPEGQTPDWVHEMERARKERRTLRMATALEASGEKGIHLGDRWYLAGKDRPPEGIRVLVEEIHPPIALWCLGLGEDARPLAEGAVAQGWTLGMADHRPGFARPERFPQAQAVLCGRPEETIPRMGLDSRSACVLLSHHWDRDREALRMLLPSPVAYVGLLGHRRRSQRLLATLTEEGFCPTGAQLAKLHAPVGLDLGGDGASGLALAVLAEVQAVMAGRHGGHLRDRQGPIHG